MCSTCIGGFRWCCNCDLRPAAWSSVHLWAEVAAGIHRATTVAADLAALGHDPLGVFAKRTHLLTRGAEARSRGLFAFFFNTLHYQDHHIAIGVVADPDLRDPEARLQRLL